MCILTGGLSSRMGRDKSRLRIGRRTLLGHVRAAALASGLPVRLIRRDVVPRCGPLGGIFTALDSTRHRAVIFLSCDQPFVARATIAALARAIRSTPFFYSDAEGVVGFPSVITKAALPIVAEQIARTEFSLQKLARRLDATTRPIPVAREWEWFNVNTPEELLTARELWRAHGQT